MLEFLKDLTAKEISLLTALFGGVMVLLNLGITIVVNYIFYLRKRVDERKYQSNYDFYQKLIIDNVTKFIHFPVQLHSEIDKVFSNFFKARGKDKRKVIEDGCDSIEIIYEEFKREVMPLIKCYSSEFHITFDSLVEDIYDETILVITELFSQEIGHSSPDYLKSKYAKSKEQFLVSLFDLLKKHRPSPTGRKRYNIQIDSPNHLPIIYL